MHTYFMIALFTTASLLSSMAQSTSDCRFDKDGVFTLMQVADIQDDDTPAERTLSVLANAISRHHPNLIVLTGDNTSSFNQKGGFEKAIAAFIDLFKTNNTFFAVTFGNHDSEKTGEDRYTRDEQYALYKQLGGRFFVDHDIPSLSGTGSGVIPILEATGAKPLFNIFLMDSGAYAKGGYDGVRADQIKWYEETSGSTPCLWFQHIPVPDILTSGLLLAVPTNTPTCVFHKKGEYSGTGWLLATDRATGKLKEAPAPTARAPYGDADHTNEGRTLYASWQKMRNLKGAYFGHDHENTFDGTDTNGIRLGYTKAATLQSYNDNNPGVRLFWIKKDGTFTTETITESSLAKPVKQP
jgi:hypothetical protein